MKQFLYLDIDIVNSIIAQSNNGLVQTLSNEQEKSDSESDSITSSIQANGTIGGAVFKIAKALEFEIVYGKFKQENVYGVMWDGDEPLDVGGRKLYRAILLNKQDSIERQAFTVAHELGHFMLHCQDDRNFYERYHGGAEQTESEKMIEDQADFFAANLLLPQNLIKAYIAQYSFLPKTELVTKICKDFLVEKDTVLKRFEELGY